jgi:hypothetical protein
MDLQIGEESPMHVANSLAACDHLTRQWAHQLLPYRKAVSQLGSSSVSLQRILDSGNVAPSYRVEPKLSDMAGPGARR